MDSMASGRGIRAGGHRSKKHKKKEKIISERLPRPQEHQELDVRVHLTCQPRNVFTCLYHPLHGQVTTNGELEDASIGIRQRCYSPRRVCASSRNFWNLSPRLTSLKSHAQREMSAATLGALDKAPQSSTSSSLSHRIHMETYGCDTCHELPWAWTLNTSVLMLTTRDDRGHVLPMCHIDRVPRTWWLLVAQRYHSLI